MDDKEDNFIDDLKNTLITIERLNGGISLTHNRDLLKSIVTGLIKNVPYCSHSTLPDFKIFRGRIENKAKLTSSEDFSYLPLKDSKNYGRCNSPNSTIFYGANNTRTVFSELAPEVGDIVYIGEAMTNSDHQPMLTSIGELDHIRRFDYARFGGDVTANSIFEYCEKLSPDGVDRALLVDAFFADIFSKPAFRDDEYKLTSTLIEVLLNPYLSSLDIDGVAYPSVAHRGGINYVISPNSFDDMF